MRRISKDRKKMGNPEKRIKNHNIQTKALVIRPKQKYNTIKDSKQTQEDKGDKMLENDRQKQTEKVGLKAE